MNNNEFSMEFYVEYITKILLKKSFQYWFACINNTDNKNATNLFDYFVEEVKPIINKLKYPDKIKNAVKTPFGKALLDFDAKLMKKSFEKKVSILEKFFSIRNDWKDGKKYKVVTILGVKIKIKIENANTQQA